ncbi:MAG: beta-ketoacyl synthase [Brumimicrobium sp.]|nr:beta-ketoacyl synthase [Brumimicrobium sp.]
MSNSQRHISVFTGGGECFTPMGISLSENVEGIKKGESGIHLHSDSNLAETEFQGAIIDKTTLENEFSQIAYQGEFTSLEKMLLVTIHRLLPTFKADLTKRCGLILSTTKGNIESLENDSAVSYYLQDLAQKIASTVGIQSPPIVLSNACVSGIMAISVAKRLIQAGTYDHFLVIGGDLFSRFVFSGFQAFQAVSSQPCKPYDKNRDGITLGEATAAMFISKEQENFTHPYEIVGDGSVNDANHISGPSRTGEGLYQSIQSALKEANIDASLIDCISSHGTATMYNDEMEAQAFNRSNLQETPVTSLKPCFGHTLGAAGLLETVISLRFADENLVPPNFNFQEHGLTLPLNVNMHLLPKETNYILKTASGFGGSNTAVIFKKVK